MTPCTHSDSGGHMTPCIDHGFKGNDKGYGIINYGGKLQYAHRVAFCISNGLAIEQIKGLIVRHKCDNSRCVNHDHLLIGTLADNNRDMYERGRAASPPKLTPDQVRDIRDNCVPGQRGWRGKHNSPKGYSTFARKFGVPTSSVRAVFIRKTYKDVI